MKKQKNIVRKTKSTELLCNSSPIVAVNAEQSPRR